MHDDGFRELHGATPMAGKSSKPVTIRERDNTIAIYEDFFERLILTPASARFMARKLNRVALRIEKRNAAQAIEARRAATGTGAVHESAVRQDAPVTSPERQSHD
jgi:hypothetical protein